MRKFTKVDSCRIAVTERSEMRQKSMTKKNPAKNGVRDIQRKTGKQYYSVQVNAAIDVNGLARNAFRRVGRQEHYQVGDVARHRQAR